MKKKLLVIFISVLCAVCAFFPSCATGAASSTATEKPDYDNYEPETSGGKDVRIVLQENIASSVEFLKYCNNDRNIFSLSEGQAALWDAESGKLLRMLVVKQMGLSKGNSADISPDGKTCVYISPAGSFEAINMLTGTVTVIAEEGQIQPSSVAFSPDGKWFGVTSETEFFLYDATSMTLKYTISFNNQHHFDNLSFSYDSKYIACSTFYSAIIYNFKADTGKIFKGDIGRTAFSKNNKYAAYYLTHDSIIVRDLRTYDVVATVSHKGGFQFFTFSQDGNSLLYIPRCETETIMVYDIATGSERKWDRQLPDKASFYSIGLAHCGKTYALGAYGRIFQGESDAVISGKSSIESIYVGSTDSITAISFRDKSTARAFTFSHAQTAASSQEYEECFAPTTVLFDGGFWSDNTAYYKDGAKKTFEELKVVLEVFNGSDNSVVAFPSEDSNVRVYDTESKKMLLRVTVNSPYGLNHESKLSPKKHFLAISNYKVFGIYEIATGKKIFSADVDIVYTVFSSDDTICAFNNKHVENGETVYGIDFYDTRTKRLVKFIEGVTLQPIALSADTNFLLYSSNKGYYVYNLKTDEKVRVHAATITKAYFSSDNTKLITWSSGENNIHTYSAKTGALLATLVADGSGNWLTYTPDGYFSGTDYAVKNFVHIVDGMKIIDVSQVAETRFRPDLVASALGISQPDGGQNLQPQSLSEVIATGDAPVVQFTSAPTSTKSRDVALSFSVQDAGGGIGAVYLSLNGKVICLAEGSRKFSLEGANAAPAPKSAGGKTVQFSHTVSLQNGENTLEAYATNAAGKIESRHAVTKISWQGSTAKPNLYVLAVGVNKYRDKSLWLNYAVPDATSIADQFRSVKGNLYQSVNVTTVFDGDVTADGISSAFNSLAGKVGADDVFIFYLSGHGTTHTDGDYYFIPVDFRFRNAQSVPETAVSKHFITEQLSKIKAQKTLVMLDTCNSGAFISTGARGMAEKTAIDRLSRATGQATIAASSDTQSAMEGYEGHGIFTFVILEGLSGKADANKDGYVSLSELSQYAEEKVPDYSYAKWGYEQYPQVDLRKQSNFPLVGK